MSRKEESFDSAIASADIIAQKKTVLITAPSTHGKTILVRDFARLVADYYAGRKVRVIDRGSRDFDKLSDEAATVYADHAGNRFSTLFS
ncbi:hypothetical protein HDU86_000718 [Geranomyces michiganensis]|nr:hypothetical protein HDU86_000718 [Geranomyces michiganensis]